MFIYKGAEEASNIRGTNVNLFKSLSFIIAIMSSYAYKHLSSHAHASQFNVIKMDLCLKLAKSLHVLLSRLNICSYNFAFLHSITPVSDFIPNFSA